MKAAPNKPTQSKKPAGQPSSSGRKTPGAKSIETESGDGAIKKRLLTPPSLTVQNFPALYRVYACSNVRELEDNVKEILCPSLDVDINFTNQILVDSIVEIIWDAKQSQMPYFCFRALYSLLKFIISQIKRNAYGVPNSMPCQELKHYLIEKLAILVSSDKNNEIEENGGRVCPAIDIITLINQARNLLFALPSKDTSDETLEMLTKRLAQCREQVKNNQIQMQQCNNNNENQINTEEIKTLISNNIINDNNGINSPINGSDGDILALEQQSNKNFIGCYEESAMMDPDTAELDGERDMQQNDSKSINIASSLNNVFTTISYNITAFEGYEQNRISLLKATTENSLDSMNGTISAIKMVKDLTKSIETSFTATQKKTGSEKDPHAKKATDAAAIEEIVRAQEKIVDEFVNKIHVPIYRPGFAVKSLEKICTQFFDVLFNVAIKKPAPGENNMDESNIDETNQADELAIIRDSFPVDELCINEPSVVHIGDGTAPTDTIEFTENTIGGLASTTLNVPENNTQFSLVEALISEMLYVNFPIQPNTKKGSSISKSIIKPITNNRESETDEETEDQKTIAKESVNKQIQELSETDLLKFTEVLTSLIIKEKVHETWKFSDEGLETQSQSEVETKIKTYCMEVIKTFEFFLSRFLEENYYTLIHSVPVLLDTKFIMFIPAFLTVNDAALGAKLFSRYVNHFSLWQSIFKVIPYPSIKKIQTTSPCIPSKLPPLKEGVPEKERSELENMVITSLRPKIVKMLKELENIPSHQQSLESEKE